jgi:molybdate transport system permease protein
MRSSGTSGSSGSAVTAVPRAQTWWGVNVLAVVGCLFLGVPVISLLAHIPWPEFGSLLVQPQTLQAAALSLLTSASAALMCLLCGTALALWLAHSGRISGLIVRVLVFVPLVMPPLIGGVALLSVFGQRGLLGQQLSAWGIYIPFTTAAVILAQAFVALPFMVITVEAALRAGGSRFARVASGLGASPATVLRRVTLPLIRPALIAGTLLCFARAMGEYGATALFAGSSPGTTRTLTQSIAAVFQGTSAEESTGYAMAGILMLLAVAVVFLSGLWQKSFHFTRGA